MRKLVSRFNALSTFVKLYVVLSLIITETIGMALATSMSYTTHQSVLLATGHGLLSWFYVYYALIFG